MKINVRWGDDHGSFMTLFVVVVGFVFFWYVTSYARPITNAPTPTPEENTAIVAFGGSLAAGAGSLSGESYVDMLSEETHTTIVNEGRLGELAHEAARRAEAIAAMRPRVTILEVGSHDSTDEREFTKRMERIISILHESGSAVIILEVPGHGRIYRDLSRQYNTAYVPNIMAGLPGNDEYMFDEIHPSTAGHKKIAERVEPVLVDLLRK